MIKGIIAGIFLLIGAIAAARRYWYKQKLETAVTDVAQQLDAGNLDMNTIAQELHACIRRKSYQEIAGLASRAVSVIHHNLPKKFSIAHTRVGHDADAVILAQAKVKEIAATYGGTREYEQVYPCWLYIKELPEENMIEFRSSVPHNKEHQYLLEDLADHAFQEAIRGQGLAG